ncbi:MAG: malonate decarboxylase holo-[acyl-carrier-protein] synthase [Burkholderiaceae bacterium]
MTALHRHRLVRLRPGAWTMLAGAPDNDAARAALAHWAAHDLPLVVARRHPGQPASMLRLGLPLPECWGRQRIGLQVDAGQVASLVAFASVGEVEPLVAPHARLPVRGLHRDLTGLGLQARVYGSHGWQHLTGLRYLHAASDLDLLVEVVDAVSADRAAALLAGFVPNTPRLDGELVFADGTAVAWREWRDWRAGRVEQLLLKRIDAVTLATDAAWLDTALQRNLAACR